MAIIEAQNNPGFWGGFGSSFGKSLTSGLEGMIQHKMSQIQKNQQAGALSQLLNMPAAQAQAVAMLPPKLQELYLQNYQQEAQQQYPGEQAQPSFEKMFQPEAQQQTPTQIQQGRPSMEQLLAGPGSQFAKLSPDMQNQINALMGQQQQPMQPEQQQPQQQPMQQPAQQQQQIQAQRQKPAGRYPFRDKKEADRQEAMALKREGLELKKELAGEAATRKGRESITAAANQKREEKAIYETMKEVIKSGDLPNPNLYNLAQKLGLDFPAMMSGNAQLMEKLRADLASTFGRLGFGKVSNIEFEGLMKGIPSLVQSTEGQLKVIELKLDEAKAVIALDDAQNEIIEENNGKYPLNLLYQARKRAEPKISAFHNDMKKLAHESMKPGNRGRPVDESGNQLIEGNGKFYRKKQK